MENNEFMPGYLPEDTKAQGMTDIHVSISTKELQNMANWAKFRGVMDIIIGVLNCLGLVTAIYGVPLIIAGIKLLDSVSALQEAIKSDNQEKIVAFFNGNRQFFMFSGISTIIKTVFMLLMSLVWGALMLLFFKEIITQPELREFLNPETFSSL